jgi:hypothetical protein
MPSIVATNIVSFAATGLSPLKKKPTAFFGVGFLPKYKDSYEGRHLILINYT